MCLIDCSTYMTEFAHSDVIPQKLDLEHVNKAFTM